MSARLTLVVPDLFDQPNGIARISQALALACAGWVEERGGSLAVKVLHDRGGARDARICPLHVAYHGYASDRRRFALDVLAATLRAPRTVTLFGHVNFAPLALPASLRGGRHVVVGHGVEIWVPLTRLRRLALGRATEVWPISHHTGEAITSLHGLSPSRVVTLRNCLDPLQTLAPVTPPPAGPPRFLSVSRLSYGDRYKGVDRTIEAFARVRGRLPEGSTLEIVGDGDDRARLSQLAHTAGARDAVIFHGSVSDQRLDALLQACRAFVLPSLQEGFGLVFVEAMARGRAVIAARAAATPEVVRDGVTGLLVEPRDDAGLGEALVTLGGDLAQAGALGAAGRGRVEEAFLFPRYAREVAARLDALTES